MKSGFNFAKNIIADSVKKGIDYGNEKIKQTNEKYKESKEKQQEIKRVETAIKNFEQVWNTSIELRKKDIDGIAEKINIKNKKLINAVERLQRIVNYFTVYDNDCKVNEEIFHKNTVEASAAENIRLKSEAETVKKGVMAGAGTLGAVLTGVAAVGTAGTGTAISSLSGSAFLSASLAKLGGGTLAAGGLGVMGGLAVAGALFTVPTIATVFYLWTKDTEEKYGKAKEYEAKLAEEKQKLKELLREYGAIYNNLVTFDYILKRGIKLIENCCLILELEPAGSDYSRIIGLLKNVEIMTNAIADTVIVDEEGKLNPQVASQLKKLEENTENLTEQTGYFIYTHNYKDLFKDNEHKIRVIENEEIQQMLYKTLAEAKYEICISCPWLSEWIKRNEHKILDRIGEALKRGVNFKIICGLGCDLAYGPDNRYETTKAVRAHMLKEFEDRSVYKGRIVFHEENTHFKILICDESYYILTSYNFLSFKGYGGRDNRLEGGEYSENKTILREHKKKFDF